MYYYAGNDDSALHTDAMPLQATFFFFRMFEPISLPSDGKMKKHASFLFLFSKLWFKWLLYLCDFIW